MTTAGTPSKCAFAICSTQVAFVTPSASKTARTWS